MLFICETTGGKEIMNRNFASNLIRLYIVILKENRIVSATYRTNFLSNNPYIIHLKHQTNKSIVYIYLYDQQI